MTDNIDIEELKACTAPALDKLAKDLDKLRNRYVNSLMGDVMKALDGKANPQITKRLVAEKLEALTPIDIERLMEQHDG